MTKLERLAESLIALLVLYLAIAFIFPGLFR